MDTNNIKPIVIIEQNDNNNESNSKQINNSRPVSKKNKQNDDIKNNNNFDNNGNNNIIKEDNEGNKNETNLDTNRPMTTSKNVEKNNSHLAIESNKPQLLEINKKFEKSTSSIQIDNNVDFTIIKMDKNSNKKNNDNENDSDSNKSDSKKSSISSKKKRNKTKVVNDDLEILNVDDIEQTEGGTLEAQKPIGYKGDYYTMNQELLNNNKNNFNASIEKQTEDEEFDENENDPNEPKVITNSFFTEDENFKLKKEKKNSNKNDSKNKKNDIVVIKNNALLNSEHNSSTSLECEINDISDHGKINKNNNFNMNTNDDNGNTHPFSVF